MAEIPLGLLIGGACVLFAIAVFTVLVAVAIRSSRRISLAWAEAGRRLGLEYTQKTFPGLRGRLEGIEVEADVVTKSRSGPGHGSGTSRGRAYTRVRASLPIEPGCQVICRKQPCDIKHDWQAHSTGNDDFDQVYEFFAPHTAVLPKSVCDALLAAEVPVHVINRVVVWSHLRVVDDPAVLEKALRTCANIAAAFNSKSLLD